MRIGHWKPCCRYWLKTTYRSWGFIWFRATDHESAGSMFLVWAPRGAPRSRIFSDYTWGGVGWGCVHVPSTCTRWWCTRHECYATHGVVWGGAVFCHECYGTHGVVWGGAVFTFLQLAHAGDAHAMNATLLRLDAGLLWDFTLGALTGMSAGMTKVLCTYIFIFIFIFIFILIYIYLHMYIYVYVYLHMYIYVYVYLYFSKKYIFRHLQI